MKFLKSLLRMPGSTETPRSDATADDAKQRGNGHMAAGAFDDAAACYREALRLKPDFAEALNNLGLAYIAQNKHIDAETNLVQALALNPKLGLAHFNLGIIAEEAGRIEEACDRYRAALDCLPDNPQIGLALAHVLHALNREVEARPILAEITSRFPDIAEAHANLGLVLRDIGRYGEAMASYQRALALDGDPAHYYSIGLIHQEVQRWSDALDCYRTACRLKPDHSLAWRNLTLLLLLLDEYTEGLALHERRIFVPDVATRQWPGAQFYVAAFSPDKYWDGTPLDGRSLLVWTEQGLGDSIMMARYLPMLKADAGAARLTVLCEGQLARLLRNVNGVDEVVVKEPGGAAVGPFDAHCSSMSLPYLFGTRTDAIPAPMSGLTLPAGTSERWAARLAGLPGRKVGLVWSGNPTMEKDELRSIPLGDFSSAIGIPGTSWISLQKGEAAAQLAGVGWPIVDWMNECGDLLDTAALIAGLDLVICVDTAVAHLAGALGKPVWLLNRFESEWRWGIGREHSPWYPTMRIFRQPALRDWASVIGRIAGELRNWNAGPAPEKRGC